MYKDSKQLKSQDKSGDEFSHILFPDIRFSELFVDFDRIQSDYRTNTWLVIDHILIEKPISSIDDLSEKNKSHILKLNLFIDFVKEKSNCNIKLMIDFYFSKDSPYKDKIFYLNENNSIMETSLSEYSLKFRELNFFGNESHRNKTYNNITYTNDGINSRRENDSAFSISKAYLGNDVTYGFNIDKIIFNPKSNDICILEYLLCEETQIVTPFTSHPNKYFLKNSRKFINLFKFAQDIKSPIFLINYAKPGTKHEDKVLWMKLLDVDPNNRQRNYVTTKDIKLNKEQSVFFLHRKFLNTDKPKNKI